MRAHKQPPVIGLLGGIGSGKSTVAEILAQLGCEVINADQLAHEQLKKPTVVKKLVRLFGPLILDNQGGIDKAKLANIAFNDKQHLNLLNKTLHPPVLREIRRRLASIRKRKCTTPAVVIDAPLLLETNLHQLCQQLWFIRCPRQLRLTRLRRRRKWKESTLSKRERHQIDLNTKRQLADTIIDNNCTRRTLRKKVTTALRTALEELTPISSRTNRL